MTTKSKPAPKTSTNRRQMRVSGITIKLGDLFAKLPVNPEEAIEWVAREISATNGMSCEDASQTVKRFYVAIQESLLNEAFQNPGAGPKGPRLPTGVRFIDLMPHLLEARHVLLLRVTRFDDWVMAHKWPGKLHPAPMTVRTWLTRYARQIALMKTVQS